jgi:HD-GYP domain-containing protein (c-di-GMP phosphodiesterase class II)
MDGAGHPRGLKSDEILPMARVLTISDVLDAMTSARSYRPASTGYAASALPLRS